MAKKNPEIRLRRPRYKIDPVILSLEKNDDYEWAARDEEVTIWFPPNNPFGIVDPVNIKENETKEFHLSTPKPKRGVYEYNVYFHQSDTMAEGSSPPIIIINGD